MVWPVDRNKSNARNRRCRHHPQHHHHQHQHHQLCLEAVFTLESLKVNQIVRSEDTFDVRDRTRAKERTNERGTPTRVPANVCCCCALQVVLAATPSPSETTAWQDRPSCQVACPRALVCLVSQRVRGELARAVNHSQSEINLFFSLGPPPRANCAPRFLACWWQALGAPLSLTREHDCGFQW